MDEERASAESLRAILHSLGYEVLLALDGPTALALAAAHHPTVALVDIGLPGMDGFEVERRLRAIPALAHGCLVALTVRADAECRDPSTRDGAGLHTVTPFELDVIGRLMHDAARLLTDDERIDEAGMESFPASDPPSWTSGLERAT